MVSPECESYFDDLGLISLQNQYLKLQRVS